MQYYVAFLQWLVVMNRKCRRRTSGGCCCGRRRRRRRRRGCCCADAAVILVLVQFWLVGTAKRLNIAISIAIRRNMIKNVDSNDNDTDLCGSCGWWVWCGGVGVGVAVGWGVG